MRRGRWVVAILAWVLCAGGLAALALNASVQGRKALLKAARPAPGAPATPSPSPSPDAPRILRTPGGNVVAGCDGSQVRVRYLSPAAGFHIVSADRAPGPQSRVTFKSDGREVRVVVRCAGDGPHADVEG
ncbi:hypothetical protein [Dactylosporangium sp. NPDC049140]|jgi:hypothetical protein|uniref:hypothetical protein n=1 Tax=Dactylosporangium sp. NPDC049140 TaxID=3155647 RepID=UPI00340584E2